MAASARTAPGVELVSEIRGGDAKRGDGDTIHVTGVDADVTKVVAMTWTNGDSSVPAELGDDGAFVTDRYAEDNNLRMGSPVIVRTPTGATLDLRIEGIFDEPKGGSPFGNGVAISKQSFDASFASRDNDLTLLNVGGDPSDANTAALARSVSAYPDVEVKTRDEFKDDQLSELKTTLNVLYALLGLSVIVSLFGVVNTLVLSVFERTRELGMLRAIGMTRRQVRRMIRHESIVTALIGAALGIGVGLFLAVITTLALSKYGIVFRSAGRNPRRLPGPNPR